MREPITRKRVEEVVASLKDFQRRTVDYAFERLFCSGDGSRRFLVADEVGLGKTLVARGITARAIEHLQDEVERVDIVYVCSNQDIVRQNLNRLNFLQNVDADALCTRITLMPIQASELNSRRVNMLGLTPGTSFNLKSSTGRAIERALIWRMLNPHWHLSKTRGATKAFRCTCGKKGWKKELRRMAAREIDASLQEAFVSRVLDDADLRNDYQSVCSEFSCRPLPPGANSRRGDLIAKLRMRLATVCVRALEPDLIILDEFQRYREIIEGGDDESLLAHELLNWEEVRLLLLSATPYKMYTGSGEDEDHYDDFIAVTRFLLDDDASVDQLKEALGDFRTCLHGAHYAGMEPLKEARNRVQALLCKVMVRSERGRSADEEMVQSEKDEFVPLEPSDLHDYALFDQLGETIEGPAPVDYWKSAPYLLNVLDGPSYKLKRQLIDRLDAKVRIKPESMPDGALLRPNDIEKYAELDPRNGRMRALIADMLDNEAWRLLWIPPSLPYYRNGSHYDRPELRNFTKRLVFSSWSMVPRAIATLCSFEAERRMMAEAQKVQYSKATSDIGRLLEFSREQGRLTGMPVLGMLYPCVTLATEIDPLREAIAHPGGIHLDELRTRVEAKVRELLEPIIQKEARIREGRTKLYDEAWYWAALARLDATYHPETAQGWLETGDAALRWSKMLDVRSDEGKTNREPKVFPEHVTKFKNCFAGDAELGAPPEDLYEVIAQMALAGPGVASLRGLLRQAPAGLSEGSEHLMAGAARMALGFRTLFSLHDVRAMLRPPGRRQKSPYWRIVLEHCVGGNLQAVMDEYVHVLRESLGLIDACPAEIAQEVAEEVAQVLSLMGAPLSLDHLDWGPRRGLRKQGDIRLRCRYALRFGDLRLEDSALVRRGDVRRAFNSPFRPFILATTSIGQEGLDFHLYCHSICHWNLPSNPVDLEQREGRINRYKCHAIRRSVARDLGFPGLQSRNGDPWRALFRTAKTKHTSDQTELVPWWVYNGPNSVKIQRIVPMLPLSREAWRLPALKEALAAYRLVFGQPRQEDLLNYIVNCHGEGSEIDIEALGRCQIDLAPPE